MADSWGDRSQVLHTQASGRVPTGAAQLAHGKCRGKQFPRYSWQIRRSPLSRRDFWRFRSCWTYLIQNSHHVGNSDQRQQVCHFSRVRKGCGVCSWHVTREWVQFQLWCHIVFPPLSSVILVLTPAVPALVQGSLPGRPLPLLSPPFSGTGSSFTVKYMCCDCHD